MNTFVCPKCGTENPSGSLNCTQCKINLQFALEHPDQVESAKSEGIQQEKAAPQQADTKSETILVVFALILLVVCCVVWVLSSMLLSPPVFGPCAHGGRNYDTYLSLVQYWSLHLLFGFFIVIARILVGARPQGERKGRWGLILNISIGLWIVVAFLIWILIFRWLCV